MLKVNIICVGNLKEKYLKEAYLEYTKRLSRYCKLNLIEIKEYKTFDNPSDFQIIETITNEGRRILQKLDTSYIVSMCIEGQEFSSEEMAKKINKILNEGISNITFIIGGAWGLSEEVKRSSNLKLSMSKMTFPHQLARIMLCEQLYRIFQILNGGKYHK